MKLQQTYREPPTAWKYPEFDVGEQWRSQVSSGTQTLLLLCLFSLADVKLHSPDRSKPRTFWDGVKHSL